MHSHTRSIRVSCLLLLCFVAGAFAQQTPDPHAYFTELCKTPGAVCYSLREQAMIDQYKNLTGEVKVNYDASMQAARWQWVKDDESAENIRMPIMLAQPTAGSRKLLIISDHRWDSAWFTEFKDALGRQIGGWKWLQVTAPKSPTNPEQQIWFEPQMRGLADNDWMNDTPPVLSLFGARGYFGIVPPTTNLGVMNPCPRPVDMGGATLGPMLNCFRAYANTWTRVWIELTMTAGTDYTSISWWMADENQVPVQILKDAKMLNLGGPHTEFWYEYDTSREARVGGPMAAWGRNVIVLKDVADPKPLLLKPLTGGVVVPPPPPVDPCLTDVPSLFVTRWEHTTGKPGSKMRVNFQPSSISPITEIEAKVNGQVVARVTGDDLRGTAGMWFTTPELGSHKLTVWAKNAVGCTREVFSPVDLVVK